MEVKKKSTHNKHLYKSEKKRNEKRRKESTQKLPVTLLSGFLGAGKTTLLKHVLESNHNMKIAVIVNDMASLNIDASLVEKSAHKKSNSKKDPMIVHTTPEIVAMQNGCICCSLRTDLVREINRLQQHGTFDYLIIESTGIAEPMNVAESFVLDPDTNTLASSDEKMLSSVARLDTCVTVVDSSEFPVLMNSKQSFEEVFQAEMEANKEAGEGSKHISALLTEQIEFANVIILNKTDLISSEQLANLRTLIQCMNPSAKIISSSYGKIALEEIINTRLFNMEDAQHAAGWLQSLTHPHTTESEEYGMSSFVFQARKPFHPQRLATWVQDLFTWQADNDITFRSPYSHDDVYSTKQEQAALVDPMSSKFGWIVRSKGFVWIAGRDAYMGEWAQQGRWLSIQPLMPWYVDIPREEWSLPEAATAKLDSDMMPVHGDRRQEIVFIGIRLAKEKICEALNAALMTDMEMEDYMLNNQDIEDCLPPWITTIHDRNVVPMVDNGLFHTILRPNQNQVFTVAAGCSLKLQQLTLDWTSCGDGDEAMIYGAAKIWLDCNQRASILLGTLRPHSVEQIQTTIEISGKEEESGDDLYYQLRVQMVWKRNKQEREPSNAAVKVYVIGCVEVLEEDDEMDDEEHECSMHQE